MAFKKRKDKVKLVDKIVLSGRPAVLDKGINYLEDKSVIEIPAYLESAFDSDFNYGQYAPGVGNYPLFTSVKQWLRDNDTIINRIKYFFSK